MSTGAGADVDSKSYVHHHKGIPHPVGGQLH